MLKALINNSAPYCINSIYMDSGIKRYRVNCLTYEDMIEKGRFSLLSVTHVTVKQGIYIIIPLETHIYYAGGE